MQLYVKLDHVAGLRSAGGGREPEPSIAASLAELEGAKGITLHLHSDRATVQLRDIRVLLETLSIPLNLELSISTKNRQHAFDLRPAAITLVREPMDVKADRWPLEVEDKGGVASFIEALKEADIRAGVMIRPEIDAVRWAHKIGAQIIVIDTTSYAMAKTITEQTAQIARLTDCVKLGGKLGLETHASGGINTRNLGELARLRFAVVHIGHALVARALLVGMSRAVRDIIEQIEKESA